MASPDLSPVTPAAVEAPMLAVAGFMWGVFGLAESLMVGIVEDELPQVGVVLTLVPAILGIIFGVFGTHQARRRDVSAGLATTGFICGALALVIGVVWVAGAVLLRALGG